MSAAARKGAALQIDCRALTWQTVPIPEQVAVLVVHSGVSRELAGGAYNARRAECGQAAVFFGVASLRDLGGHAIAGGPEGLDATAYRRARHVSSENARVHRFAAALQAGDLGGWLRFQIADFGVPDAVRAALWPELCADICQRLARGERGVVHCMGGCGRTGMIVLRLMVVLGEQPDASLARLRECRACCVETEPQRLWALAQDRVG